MLRVAVEVGDGFLKGGKAQYGVFHLLECHHIGIELAPFGSLPLRYKIHLGLLVGSLDDRDPPFTVCHPVVINSVYATYLKVKTPPI